MTSLQCVQARSARLQDDGRLPEELRRPAAAAADAVADAGVADADGPPPPPTRRGTSARSSTTRRSVRVPAGRQRHDGVPRPVVRHEGLVRQEVHPPRPAAARAHRPVARPRDPPGPQPGDAALPDGRVGRRDHEHLGQDLRAADRRPVQEVGRRRRRLDPVVGGAVRALGHVGRRRDPQRHRDARRPGLPERPRWASTSRSPSTRRTCRRRRRRRHGNVGTPA